MNVRWSTAACALAVLLACSATEPTYGGPPDDRGLLVAAVFAEPVELTWSTDGTELYFLDAYLGIRAVTATGGNSRVLYTSSISLGSLRAAGNKLYVSYAAGFTTSQIRLLRIDPGNSHVDTVLTYHGQTSDHFAISADERFVAFGDSLFDLVSATQVALPGGVPWSFSPDGSLLLYELAQAGGGLTSFTLIATSGAPSQPVASASGIQAGSLYNTVGAHHWNGNDPKLLRVAITADMKLVKAFVFDMRTATNHEIASISSDTFQSTAAISADGKRAVVWKGPFTDWVQLYAIDTETLAEAMVATVKSKAFTMVQGVVLSPDGSRAAYVVLESASFSGPSVPEYIKVYVVSQ